MLFVEIKFWLVFQGCLIHIYLQYVPHFDSLIHLNPPSCDIFFSSFALAGNVSCYLLVLHWAGIGLICISIFISSVLAFCRNFVFWLILNSECDAYLPVDHSLVYGHSKMFLILSLILG